MLFKTTVLALLESHPTLYQQLRLSRRLMQEMDRYAGEMKTAYLLWLDAGMNSSEATEKVTAEIESRIASEADRLEGQPSSTM
jgi:hypothetical protein